MKFRLILVLIIIIIIPFFVKAQDATLGKSKN